MTSRTHKIKIKEDYYESVLNGNKTFEIRYNDRGYQKGDLVQMRVEYSSLPTIWATISYVTGFNQKDNWVVFGLHNVKTQDG